MSDPGNVIDYPHAHGSKTEVMIGDPESRKSEAEGDSSNSRD